MYFNFYNLHRNMKTQIWVYIFQYIIVEDRQNLKKRGNSLSQN